MTLNYEKYVSKLIIFNKLRIVSRKLIPNCNFPKKETNAFLYLIIKKLIQ